MRRQYRIEWRFDGRPPLVRLVHFDSHVAAFEAVTSEEFTRPIFRRAGLAVRTTSAFEYTDRFPMPVSVTVHPVDGRGAEDEALAQDALRAMGVSL